MKCFNHSNADAVGVCKVCSKGICTDCLTDTGSGITCKTMCEEEAAAINKILEYNKSIVFEGPNTKRMMGNVNKLNKTAHSFNAYLFLVFGAAFFTFYIYSTFRYGSSTLFLPIGALGIVFLVFSFFAFRIARRAGTTLTLDTSDQ